jgi:hypothetical protein
MSRQWFRMYDPDPRGVLPVTRDEAAHWNEQGFGIFWAVNEFDGPRRKEHLRRICAWAVDMDEGTKAEQAERLLFGPLIPTLVVETKRGYQAYWQAKDGTAEAWDSLVLERLVPYYGADKNARDLARILRVPGYYHCKDPADRYLCQVVHRHQVSYRQVEIAQCYPWVPSEKEHRQAHSEARRQAPDQYDDFWEAVYHLDCEEGLRRLSGHPAVGGEHFTFRRNGNGNRNILVDGKGVNCWIDQDGRIGSGKGKNGGPTLYQWIAWYGNKPRDCVAVIKELYPQLDRRH